MRRRIEVPSYLIIIAFIIIRYGFSGDDGGRRPRIERPNPGNVQVVPRGGDAVLLPAGARLPQEEGRDVRVQLESRAANGVGTAFAVTDQGVYVTARHVIDGCADVFLIRQNGRRRPQAVAVSSAQVQQGRDFAVLRTQALKPTSLTVSNRVPARGEDGFMMGYPQGNPADVRATVIGATRMRSTGRYRTYEPVVAWVERERKPFFGGSLGGISGGPVFDENGYVVGTVVAGAPRRGRVYTTHPQIFTASKLLPETLALNEEDKTIDVSKVTYAENGDRLRASHKIAQVYCKAD